MRYHENLGDFVHGGAMFQSPPAMRGLLKVVAFEACVRSGDRTLGNVLLLQNFDVLAIDELRAFQFQRPQALRFRRAVRLTLQHAFADTEWWGAHARAVQATATGPMIRAVLSRFLLEEKAAPLAERVLAVSDLTRAMIR